MKLQFIIAGLGAGLLIAQEDPKPEPRPPRQPDEALPFPPPQRPVRDGEQPRPGRPDGDRPGERFRPIDPERRGIPGSPGDAPLDRGPLKMQPYIGLVTRMAGPEIAAQLRQPEGFGLIVDAVLDESPAKAAGLERNDLIQKLDDQWLVNPPQLEALVRRAGKGAEVSLTILRRGEEKKIATKIGEKMMPERRMVRPFEPGEGDLRDPRLDYLRDPQPRQFDSRIDDPRAGAGERRYAQEQARLFRKDDEGSYEVVTVEGRRVFNARKPDGSMIWTGPVETPEDRAKIPEGLRRTYEEMLRKRQLVAPGRRGAGTQEPRPGDAQPAR